MGPERMELSARERERLKVLQQGQDGHLQQIEAATKTKTRYIPPPDHPWRKDWKRSMALDEADHRLFVHARDPGKVLVIDSESGKLITSLPCVGDYDDAIL